MHQPKRPLLAVPSRLEAGSIHQCPPPTIGGLLTPTNTLGLPTMLRNPGVRQGWDAGPSQYSRLGDHGWREDVPAGLCPEEDIKLTWLIPEVK